jgi:hypothetical protein
MTWMLCNASKELIRELKRLAFFTLYFLALLFARGTGIFGINPGFVMALCITGYVMTTLVSLRDVLNAEHVSTTHKETT